MSVEKYGWAIQKIHTPENSKMFNITSKYFIFFNNKPAVS